MQITTEHSKFKVHLPYEPIILCAGLSSTNILARLQNHKYGRIFITALLEQIKYRK